MQNTKPKAPRWVPYVGIVLGAIATSPLYMAAGVDDWPFWLGAIVGGAQGIVTGYTTKALWLINNGGTR